MPFSWPKHLPQPHSVVVQNQRRTSDRYLFVFNPRWKAEHAVPAHRHTNPDGSLGGWVDNRAEVYAGCTIEPDAIVYGRAQLVRGTVLKGRAQVYGPVRLDSCYLQDEAHISVMDPHQNPAEPVLRAQRLQMLGNSFVTVESGSLSEVQLMNNSRIVGASGITISRTSLRDRAAIESTEGAPLPTHLNYVSLHGDARVNNSRLTFTDMQGNADVSGYEIYGDPVRRNRLGGDIKLVGPGKITSPICAQNSRELIRALEQLGVPQPEVAAGLPVNYSGTLTAMDPFAEWFIERDARNNTRVALALTGIEMATRLEAVHRELEAHKR